MNTVTEKVRTFGVDCRYDGPIAHKLLGLIADLQDALASIPEEFRESATVDCEPDFEFGESYEAMRITYDRPETAEEERERLAEEVAHWQEQLDSARQRLEYCEQQLSAIRPTAAQAQ